MQKGKLVLGLFVGLFSAVAIFCIAVSIGCAINGLGFGEQITNWFGNAAPAIEEIVEELPNTPVE